MQPRLNVLFALLSALLLHCGGARADRPGGFAVGYAYAAQIVCHFQGGPVLALLDYSALDSEASYLGMRNFFIALRLYDREYACDDALEAYGPHGVIRRGLLLE